MNLSEKKNIGLFLNMWDIKHEGIDDGSFKCISSMIWTQCNNVIMYSDEDLII